MEAMASVSELIVGFDLKPSTEIEEQEGVAHEEAAHHSGPGEREQFIGVNAEKKQA
ncbi:MAG: hypothetical protein KQI62_09135 [Deltaproteobacteria bacterium]|nr:hypothetical protein [Deltaproteobacteria bacterium]